MARKANSVFTSDSLKHIAIDNVETRVLETALRTLAGLPVSDDDKRFAANYIGTISTLWARLKRFRTDFESVDLFATMLADTAAESAAEKAA